MAQTCMRIEKHQSRTEDGGVNQSGCHVGGGGIGRHSSDLRYERTVISTGPRRSWPEFCEGWCHCIYPV